LISPIEIDCHGTDPGETAGDSWARSNHLGRALDASDGDVDPSQPVGGSIRHPAGDPGGYPQPKLSTPRDHIFASELRGVPWNSYPRLEPSF
jgi:hypothetical protein